MSRDIEIINNILRDKKRKIKRIVVKDSIGNYTDDEKYYRERQRADIF